MYQKHVILCDLSLRKQVIKVTACVSDNSVRTSMIFSLQVSNLTFFWTSYEKTADSKILTHHSKPGFYPAKAGN